MASPLDAAVNRKAVPPADSPAPCSLVLVLADDHASVPLADGDGSGGAAGAGSAGHGLHAGVDSDSVPQSLLETLPSLAAAHLAAYIAAKVMSSAKVAALVAVLLDPAAHCGAAPAAVTAHHKCVVLDAASDPLGWDAEVGASGAGAAETHGGPVPDAPLAARIDDLGGFEAAIRGAAAGAAGRKRTAVAGAGSPCVGVMFDDITPLLATHRPSDVVAMLQRLRTASEESAVRLTPLIVPASSALVERRQVDALKSIASVSVVVQRGAVALDVGTSGLHGQCAVTDKSTKTGKASVGRQGFAVTSGGAVQLSSVGNDSGRTGGGAAHTSGAAGSSRGGGGGGGGSVAPRGQGGDGSVAASAAGGASTAQEHARRDASSDAAKEASLSAQEREARDRVVLPYEHQGTATRTAEQGSVTPGLIYMEAGDPDRDSDSDSSDDDGLDDDLDI